MNSRKRTFMAAGCLHFPYAHEPFIEALLEDTAARQPATFILLGDSIDTQCLSRFSKANVEKLSGEYEALEEFLVRLKDSLPSTTKLVYLDGNHEDRLYKPEHSHVSDLLDLEKHVPTMEAFERKPYSQHPDSIYHIGAVSFYHGWALSANGMKKEALRFGCPEAGGCTISAHTHRPHQPRAD